MNRKDPMTVLAATPDRNCRSIRFRASGRFTKSWAAGRKHQLAIRQVPLIGFDQNALMAGWRREREPFEDTMERFRVMRQAQLRMFRAASPADLERTAPHEEYGPEPASEYLFKVAGHDLHHLEQIARLR
jgi:hypothetical protein